MIKFEAKMRFTLLFFNIFLLVFVSCNNLYHNLPVLSEPDNRIQPSIDYTYPKDGDVDIPLNKTIIISFNKEINTNSINKNTLLIKNVKTSTNGNQTVTIETIINGDIIFHDRKMVVFDPEGPELDATSDYIVNVTTGVKDNDNINLKTNYSWKFKTGEASDEEPPQVVSFEPVSNIPYSNNIAAKAVFNEDIDPSTLTASNFTLEKLSTDNSEIPISGTISYDAKSKTAIFTPEIPLNEESSYIAQIHGGENAIKDLASNSIQQKFSWGFITGGPVDIEPPIVISTEPLKFIFSVDNVLIKAVFNEDLNPFSVTNSSFLLKKIGPGSSETLIPGSVSYEVQTRTAIFIPDISLEEKASFRASLPAGDEAIKDLSDNAIEAEKNWEFTHIKTYDTPCDIPELSLDCCE